MDQRVTTTPPRGPYCPDCNATGLLHCSDPVNCGGIVWPVQLTDAVADQLAGSEVHEPTREQFNAAVLATGEV